MSDIKMPGFIAEASLYKTSGHYRHAINSSTQMSGAVYLALMGQDFPDHKCTCQGCGAGGGDVNGQCATVCKDKTVYDKGSEPYDYCKKAAVVRPPRDFPWALRDKFFSEQLFGI
jgi:hypothetical protein